MKKMFILAVGIAALAVTNAFGMDIKAMMTALEKTRQGIAETFTSIDSEISAAAQKLSAVDLKGDEARKILTELCKDKPYLIDCAIVDALGKMIMVEPEEYRGHEGSDISKQAHIVTILKDKKPIFSDVFHSVEGIEAIDFEYPIFSGKNEYLGSVSMLVRQEALTASIVMPLVEGKPCKIWIMQKDGLIIYDPDPDQVGRNIFSDELFRPFQELISFSRTVSMEKEGTGSYDFYTKGLRDQTVVKKYAAWNTVSLYGTEWRIIVMEIEKSEPIIIEGGAASPKAN